jgi:hypothetical protein
MRIRAVLGQIAVRDLGSALAWYARYFGRQADAQPMEGLAEWHLVGGGGVQVFQEPDNAGHTTLTLVVDDIDAEVARLKAQGITPDPVGDGNYVASPPCAMPTATALRWPSIAARHRFFFSPVGFALSLSSSLERKTKDALRDPVLFQRRRGPGLVQGRG